MATSTTAIQKAYDVSSGQWHAAIADPANGDSDVSASATQTIRLILERTPHTGTTAKIDTSAGTIDVPATDSGGDLKTKYILKRVSTGAVIPCSFEITDIQGYDGTTEPGSTQTPAAIESTDYSLTANGEVASITPASDTFTVGDGTLFEIGMDVTLKGFTDSDLTQFNNKTYRIRNVATNAITLEDRVTGALIDLSALSTPVSTTNPASGYLEPSWQKLAYSIDNREVTFMANGNTPTYMMVELTVTPFTDGSVFTKGNDYSFKLFSSIASYQLNFVEALTQ